MALTSLLLTQFLFQNQTKTFVDLQDGDVGDITKDSYTIETVDGEKVERKPHVLNIDPNAASKGTYEFLHA